MFLGRGRRDECSWENAVGCNWEYGVECTWELGVECTCRVLNRPSGLASFGVGTVVQA